MNSLKSWAPTRKWVASLLTGVLAIAGTAVATNGWDAEEWAALVTLGSTLSVSYLVSNENTPGGVPLKKPTDVV